MTPSSVWSTLIEFASDLRVYTLFLKWTWHRVILLSRYPVTSRAQKCARKSISVGCMFVFFQTAAAAAYLTRKYYRAIYLLVHFCCADVPLRFWPFVPGCSSGSRPGDWCFVSYSCRFLFVFTSIGIGNNVLCNVQLFACGKSCSLHPGDEPEGPFPQLICCPLACKSILKPKGILCPEINFFRLLPLRVKPYKK